MNITSRRNTFATRPEMLKGIQFAVARQFGLHADWSRLDADQLSRFVELTAKASGDTNTSDLSKYATLGKRDRRSFEKLVEVATGAEGWFEGRRVDAETQRKLHELAERAQRPAPPARLEAPGTVVLPPIVFEQLRQGTDSLDATDLVTLVVIVGQLQSGALPGATLEGGKLITTHPLGRLDPDGLVSGSQFSLKRLEAAQLITVERGGGMLTIGLGAELAKSFAARTP